MAKAWEEAGFASKYAYDKARTQSREWAQEHSRVTNSEWRPGLTGKNFRAYFDAYSSKATGSTARAERNRAAGRSSGKPSNFVKHYLVNVIHAMTAEEFEQQYEELE